MVKKYKVPVIMLHSVGTAHLDWPYNFLSENISIFEKKIDYLINHGYNFIFHEQLFNYMKKGISIPDKSIMLTFDDGFLDNWVIVFPILKKRQVKFTIYVSKEFVDTSAVCRQNLEAVWNGNVDESKLATLGYLSWEEMRFMESSGLVDVQSHTSTHTWLFSCDKIIDFLNPKNIREYPWMIWNHQPFHKPHWMFVNEKIAEELYGLPIYENSRAMVARRYYEDERLNDRLVNYVKEHGGPIFFNDNEWFKKLNEIANSYRKNGDHGRFETDEEQLKRFKYELLDNRRDIEAALCKKVRFLCWPGGAYNLDILRLAIECGYYATTVKVGRNSFGDDPSMVYRISSGNPSGDRRFPWKYPIFTLKFYIDRFCGHYWAIMLDFVYRIVSLFF